MLPLDFVSRTSAVCTLTDAVRCAGTRVSLGIATLTGPLVNTTVKLASRAVLSLSVTSTVADIEPLKCWQAVITKEIGVGGGLLWLITLLVEPLEQPTAARPTVNKTDDLAASERGLFPKPGFDPWLVVYANPEWIIV